MASDRPRRRKPFDPTALLLFFVGLAGLAAITGAIIWYGDAADHNLAVRLHATGVTTSAHDAQIFNPCTRRGCPPEPSVRAAVDLPDGPQQITLRGTDPDVRDLERDAWSVAPDDNRHGGRFTVLFDPARPRQVMEQADATRHLLHSDVAVDRTITLVSIAVVAAFALPLLWDVTPGSPGRTREQRARRRR
jgi:hypothetical protein